MLCQNNLKQITLASHSYDEARKRLLPGHEMIDSTVANGGRAVNGFLTKLLLYLEQAIMENPERKWTTEEILDYSFNPNKGAGKSTEKPGERFRYSNTNTVLLGLVIEKVTGDPWHVAVNKRVVEPLRLHHTGVPKKKGLLPHATSVGLPQRVRRPHHRLRSHFYDVSHYSASWTSTAGEMYSTMDDLGRAAQVVSVRQNCSRKGARTNYTNVEIGHEGINYGFCIGNREGKLGHSGDLPGYNVVALHLCDCDCTVIVMANLSNNNDRKTQPAKRVGQDCYRACRALKRLAAKSPDDNARPLLLIRPTASTEQKDLADSIGFHEV